ncbi:hypothetical protein [Lysinibacillus xylanilyticus]|uniref:hypothetical protein n=1 Tax=Lysinibacillus xylanilyticus TaxID=582475 RepID=UPI003D0391D8
MFTPVYGSLYGTFGVAVTDENVDFDTVGPSSGVTLNTVDDSITVNSSGVYTVTFSTEVFSTDVNLQVCTVIFRLSINGTPNVFKEIHFQTNLSTFIDFNTLSRTDQIMLNQGDVIRVSVIFANNTTYINPALVVTKVA